MRFIKFLPLDVRAGCVLVTVLMLAECTPPQQPDASATTASTCPVYPTDPETYCPGPPRAGCVVLSADPNNCGACGHVCPTGPGFGCWHGHCAPPCTPLANLCLDSATDAYTCPDLTTDVAHCGACSNVCPAGDTCRVGHCHAPTDPYWRATMTPTGAWFDACSAPGAQTVLSSATTGSATVPLPFAFPFWGVLQPAGTTVTVGPRGDVAISGGLVEALYSGGLGTRSTGVCIATFGTAPQRELVVEWSDANYFWDSTGIYHLTFETILSEGSGTVDFVYDTLTEEGATFTPTTGVSTADGSDALILCRSALDGGRVATTCPQQGMRIHLTPTP